MKKRALPEKKNLKSLPEWYQANRIVVKLIRTTSDKELKERLSRVQRELAAIDGRL